MNMAYIKLLMREQETTAVCVWGIKGKKNVERLSIGQNVREWKKNCLYNRMFDMAFIGNMNNHLSRLAGGCPI